MRVNTWYMNSTRGASSNDDMDVICLLNLQLQLVQFVVESVT